ncbi:hypothetical protein [Herbaspirillum sp.]|jgi:hypothetical protein|uniref:hypothetical protein n=1 Tax=Herbaspirillum TaxID=963 RepID=UPI002586F8A0|nr:hypothetical protein [Herbaspirillum sp.]MCP3656275.1 hypothetical protein [Herbaspirillum sp.]MCP3946368.1 hypothetical protein [Herbaspirillum sp.]MCP4030498.1 hypothetical protein [Herbaspirillum sp.]MCP4554296.1 hypothetical protein [Herbaspirillum sp.]
MKRHRLAFLCAAAFSLFNRSAVASEASQWSKDCVGHLEISLADKADVAATAFDQLFRPLRTLTSEFDDGQPALYSKYAYAGQMEITRALLSEESIRRKNSGKILVRILRESMH